MEIDIEHSRQVRGGEWRIFEHYRNIAGERTRVLDSFGVLIAETQTEAQAAQIIADHAAALNGELSELESELIQAAIAYHCRRDDGDAKFLFHEACTMLIEARYQSIKTSHATVADGGREGENGHTCIDINNAPTGVPCNVCRLERK